MATIDVKDAAGATVALEKPLAPARAAAASSRPVVLSNEDFAVIDGLEALITSTNTKLDTMITALQIIDNASTAITTINGVAAAFGSGAIGATVLRVGLATDSPGILAAGMATPANSISANPSKLAYETVAASQTAQVLGGSGATGDFVQHILVVPATTSPGNVLLLDNATSITVFTGGASSVSNLVPFSIYIGAASASGAWKLTTGANVSCVAVGNFT